ncbi:MAG: hypothetical protein IJE90_00525 [Clostridia bacterium]|nr:hypothetical protein [Clostridia bacterium]
MRFEFGKDNRSSSDLITAYSYRFDPALPFVQRDECIEAPECKEYRDGYASISLLHIQKYAPNITISAECDFEGIAAPLIMIARELKPDDSGIVRYDDYFEVVIYKKGINIWRLWPGENGKIVHRNLLRLVTPLETGKRYTLTVTVTENSISAEANGIKATIPAPDMFDSFYAGVTVCEGMCRFYNMEIK